MKNPAPLHQSSPFVSRALDLLAHSWCLSAKGSHELTCNRTRLSETELELLVRIDGSLPLEATRKQMTSLSDEAFCEVFGRLQAQGLVAPAEHDEVERRLRVGIEILTENACSGSVDDSLISLRRAGYFVSIARARKPADDLQTGAARCAIVVEDEPVLARFIASYLAFEGIKSRIASNRGEVLMQFNCRPLPDLILLDVSLPDADGFEILRRVREHRVLRQVPVIMLTAHATRESVLKGLQYGADGYITKPFEADSMMRAVRTVLGRDVDDPPEAGPWTSQLATNRRGARAL